MTTLSTEATTEALRQNIALAAQENAGLIERQRAKGRTLLIDDHLMIDAFARFLESGAEYPSDEQRGIWFPVSLRRVAQPEFNAQLSQEDRYKFARDSHEAAECPNWRERGW